MNAFPWSRIHPSHGLAGRRSSFRPVERRPLPRANVAQASIFLVPHLLILLVMPEMGSILILVLAGALFVGWIRMRSGSILGPWLVHATLNVTMALSVAVRSTV
jgi:membrane protease YdiL (CAAX protease family)